MTISELMQSMMDAGAPMEAILVAVKAIEERDRMAAEVREKAAERKRRQRDRERDCHATITGQSQGQVTESPLSPSPPLSPHTPQTPPHPHTPVNNNSRARGARLPVDWQPKPLSDECEAAVSRWQAGTLERELAKFRDWAASASGPNAVKKDWDAAWRNWIRNAEERHGTANRKHRQTAGKEDGFLSAIRHVANQPDHAQWHPE